MSPVDKAALLAARADSTRAVEVPGVGEVLVRGLTRAEVLAIQDLGPVDRAELEAKLLALALVDPALTEAEAKQWQAVAPAAELEPISDAILGLSGMRENALKEEIKQFRG